MHWLRCALLLLPIFAAGLVLAPFSARPDILIERTGSNVAVRTDGGSLVPANTRRGGFAVEAWLRADGEPTSLREAAHRSGWTCAADTCRADLKGRHVLYVHQGKTTANFTCDADILITDFPLRGRCSTVPLRIDHPAQMVVFLLAISTGFCLFGFAIGVWAKNFEQLQIIPMLVITPLTFLGGAFYSVKTLGEPFRTITLFNPVVYMRAPTFRPAPQAAVDQEGIGRAVSKSSWPLVKNSIEFKLAVALSSISRLPMVGISTSVPPFAATLPDFNRIAR